MAAFGEVAYGEASFGENAGPSTPANPQGTLSATLPKPTVALSGTYIARETGTLSATLPRVTVALSGTYTAPVTPTGTLAATLPKPTVSLSGTYTDPPHPMGTLAATLPLPTVALSGTYTGPVPTDTSNAFYGLDVAPFGHATISRPPASPPPSLVLATRYDKAVPYPKPVMVKGRPT